MSNTRDRQLPFEFDPVGENGSVLGADTMILATLFDSFDSCTTLPGSIVTVWPGHPLPTAGSRPIAT